MYQRKSAIGIAIAALLAIPLSASAGYDAQAPDTSGDMREAAVAALQGVADSNGALGLYLDDAANQYVVVLPSSAGNTFTAADASGLGLSVRVETRDIDRSTIESISDSLVALRPSIKQYSYAFSFDPQSGTVHVEAEAPESAFAAIEKAFPGKLSFLGGTFELTSWDNDAQPHWGGAWLQSSSNTCTSGWAIEDYSGHRYMVTAGHCFPNGTATNMGTAWRESLAYPAIDVELIQGHTYGAYIYDGSTHARPISNGRDPVVGGSYCTTGRNSGFKCGWTNQQINVTSCGIAFPACTYQMAAFTGPSNRVVQPGDSGGPYYFQYSGGGAGIRGVISARFVDIYGNWTSYAQQYQSIANYYVMHVPVVP